MPYYRKEMVPILVKLAMKKYWLRLKKNSTEFINLESVITVLFLEPCYSLCIGIVGVNRREGSLFYFLAFTFQSLVYWTSNDSPNINILPVLCISIVTFWFLDFDVIILWWWLSLYSLVYFLLDSLPQSLFFLLNQIF